MTNPEDSNSPARARGLLPRGIRKRITKVGVIQYGLRLKSKWLPSGGHYTWFKSGTTRDEAEKRLKEIHDLIDRAKLGLTLFPERPQIHSVKHIAEKYVRHLTRIGCAEKHLENVRHQTDEFAGLYGTLPLVAVTRDILESYLDGMIRSPENPNGRATETVRKYRQSLHGLFEFAIKVEKIVSINPVSAIMPPRSHQKEGDAKAARFVRELPPEADRKLLDSCEPLIACASAISLYHGQRREAVINLRIGGPDPDVDLIAGTIRFRGETQKRRKYGARPRKDIVVLISSHAIHYVTEQARQATKMRSIWLLPSSKDPGQHVHPMTITTEFRKQAHRAGFPHAFFHGLLHAHTSRMKSSGLADVDGKALDAARRSRGHDGGEITKRYIHVPDEDIVAVQGRLDAWIETRIQEKGDQGATKN